MPRLLFETTNVNESQLSFAHATAKRLLSIVNESSFHNKIRNARFSGRKFRLDGEVVNYVNANNSRVLDQIVNGKEWGTAPGDGIIALELTLGPTRRGTIGYIRPPDPLITTNPSYFNRCLRNNSRVSLAAHWMHEWMHVSGFRHRRATVDRSDVPYVTGTFVVEVARERAMIENQPLPFVESIGHEYLDSYREHFGCVAEGV